MTEQNYFALIVLKGGRMFDLEHGNEFEQWLVSDESAWQLFARLDGKEGEES